MDAVYIHKADGSKKLLCSTALPGSMTYHKLTVKLNASGSMEVHIPVSNTRQANINYLLDEISFERKGVEIFRGEATNYEADFLRTGKIKVAGAMDYFSHVYMEPYEFSGSVSDYLQLLLDHYNDRVSATGQTHKQIQFGICTVTDNNNYITRSNTGRVLISKLLKEKLVASLGGYMRIRVDEGIKYLDYIASFENVSTQKITYRGNIVDISQETEYGDVATVIVPLGATDEETGEQLTIESVNNGLVYYADEAAVAQYGWREMTNTWEDVTLPENLLAKAIALLNANKNPVKSVEVKAVDLSLKSDAVDTFYLGDNIISEINAQTHETATYPLTEMELYALSPENEVLTLGEEKPVTLTIGDSVGNLQEETFYMQKSNWDLANRISNADGLYATSVTQPDGSIIYYMHNQPSINDSNLQISFSSVGVFMTADRGITWYGMEMDGDVIARLIEATTISADAIRGGSLTLGGENNGNGLARVYDASGRLCVKIDNGGIKTYSATDSDAITVINGDGVSTKRFTAAERIQIGNLKIIERDDGGVTFQKADTSASSIVSSLAAEPESEEEN